MDSLILVIKRFRNIKELTEVLRWADDDFETVEELVEFLKDQAFDLGC